ncbi:beta-N-acetylhexosaminidase [Thalassotalea castellviae]|uniref:Beta-hexosaminidase n=1 Tax=Thalassotalea castellviae TaxID=3075612 RepID=A0ABU2ZYD3_9GAMM|nr:beta-N-acetylhexosaminidase [Thalassotalea sp. W431]MDT0602570.1 beta-N-acetylhexosaminidase [Thalassotalea sp. W431]
MGPIMMDVLGTSLTEEDKELLSHPLIGGLILFTRNFQSPEQLTELVKNIRAAAKKPLLIAVDHEGGRVQRFRDGFSIIPAMGKLIEYADQDIKKAQQFAQQSGALMALEVQAVGIDISFAPVLDINGISEVIGQRSFHRQPEIVTPLAQSFIEGMHSVGMKATGKHFPGHGSVQADSHVNLPIDNRSLAEITCQDLIPFQQLIASNNVDALMPAHVIYPDVDNKSVGFSRIWLQDILRNQLKFNGVIFSDDLSMEAAGSIGGYVERSEAAQEAGCDMLLLCNNRQALINVIDNARLIHNVASEKRIAQMLKTSDFSWQAMQQQPMWQELSQRNQQLLMREK